MKKKIAIILTVILTLSPLVCSKNQVKSPTNPPFDDVSDTVEFHGKAFNKEALSEETLEWLEWHNSLPEEEQLATSSIPSDLYKLCGYPENGEIETVDSEKE